MLRPSEGSPELWLVVKSCRTPYGGRGVKLTENDTFRLGRIMLRVKSDLVAHAMPMLQQLEDAACRICLSELQSADNPFISPCHCDGTMKYIHVLCLREWLRSQVHVHNSGSSVTYHWKPLSCELCKQEFPAALAPQPVAVDGPHIVLEEVRRGGQPMSSYHVVSFLGDHTAKLGRGHECDVRIADISVSRFHAQLRLIRNEVYLEDRQSKFGTLVQCSSPLTLSTGLSMAVQVDRTVLSFRVLRSWHFCCCGHHSSEGEEEEDGEMDEARSESSAGEVVESDLHAEDLGP